MIFSECTRQNTCFDCDNQKCWHHGKKEADCPKWKCDNERYMDCEHCDFIDACIEEERKEHANRPD